MNLCLDETHKTSSSNRNVPILSISAQFNSMLPNPSIVAILPRLGVHAGHNVGGVHVNGDVVGQRVIGAIVQMPEGINIVNGTFAGLVADLKAIDGGCSAGTIELNILSRNCLEDKGGEKKGFEVRQFSFLNIELM
jgi:hypothetical protein